MKHRQKLYFMKHRQKFGQLELITILTQMIPQWFYIKHSMYIVP